MPRLSVLPALLLAWTVARAGLPQDATVADLPPADELAARPEKRPASVTVTRRRRPDDPEGMTAAQIVAAVRTAPFWDGRLQQMEDNQGKVKQMAGFLKSKHKDHPNKDGSMDAKAQKAYLDKYRRELISEEDEAYAKVAKSNGGYHYFGSAKTMAQIGKAFAEAMIERTRN